MDSLHFLGGRQAGAQCRGRWNAPRAWEWLTLGVWLLEGRGPCFGVRGPGADGSNVGVFK